MISVSSKIAIVFISLCLFSCLKPVTYPNEPEIEYVSFESSSDSGKITFSFTDGDGNIGLDLEAFIIIICTLLVMSLWMDNGQYPLLILKEIIH